MRPRSYGVLCAFDCPKPVGENDNKTKQNSIHQQSIDNNTTEELHSITTTSDNKVLTITPRKNYTA
jgi:hypothetical protein